MTILKIGKGGTQTKEQKDKEIDDLTFYPRDDKLHVSRKEARNKLCSIEDCVDASIQGFYNYSEKS